MYRIAKDRFDEDHTEILLANTTNSFLFNTNVMGKVPGFFQTETAAASRVPLLVKHLQPDQPERREPIEHDSYRGGKK